MELAAGGSLAHLSKHKSPEKTRTPRVLSRPISPTDELDSEFQIAGFMRDLLPALEEMHSAAILQGNFKIEWSFESKVAHSA